MKITAKESSLKEFIYGTIKSQINIPDYQRAYSWGKRHCEELFNDINENDSGYFIGSVIWIEGNNYVIDGQQRLTSISLLLVAIYDKRKSDLNATQIKNIKQFLLIEEGNGHYVPRLNLQKQGTNKDDYKYLIDKFLLDKYSTNNNFGNRKIGVNKRIFDNSIESLSNKELKEFINKVFNLTLISVKVDDSQSGYILFERMNHRGEPLSAMDLIKNCYLSKRAAIEKDASDKWVQLVEILGTENNQEQFIRNYYNAFRKELNDGNTRYPIGNKATRSNVISIYEKIIVNKADFMDELLRRAKFNRLLTGDDGTDKQYDKFRKCFEKFRNAEATATYTLLLYLLDKQNDYKIKGHEPIELFEFILKFAIRRNLTNNPSTGALQGIWMSIINQIEELADNDKNYDNVSKIIKDELISKTSRDEDVENVLRGDIYIEHNAMARYLLCSLCKTISLGKEKFVDVREKDSKKNYIWTIEHILPEGNKKADNIPDFWIKMIRDGNKKYKKYNDQQIIDLIKEYRHKIGNLTMTGYNSSLGQKDFINKRDRKDNNGNYIGYKNGLDLNYGLIKEKKWTIAKIESRTNKLVKELMQTLKLS